MTLFLGTGHVPILWLRIGPRGTIIVTWDASEKGPIQSLPLAALVWVLWETLLTIPESPFPQRGNIYLGIW